MDAPSSGPEAERLGFKYDAGAAGNKNGGHTHGSGLRAEERDDLSEYLKTL